MPCEEAETVVLCELSDKFFFYSLDVVPRHYAVPYDTHCHSFLFNLRHLAERVACALFRGFFPFWHVFAQLISSRGDSSREREREKDLRSCAIASQPHNIYLSIFSLFSGFLDVLRYSDA